MLFNIQFVSAKDINFNSYYNKIQTAYKKNNYNKTIKLINKCQELNIIPDNKSDELNIILNDSKEKNFLNLFNTDYDKYYKSILYRRKSSYTLSVNNLLSFHTLDIKPTIFKKDNNFIYSIVFNIKYYNYKNWSFIDKLNMFSDNNTKLCNLKTISRNVRSCSSSGCDYMEVLEYQLENKQDFINMIKFLQGNDVSLRFSGMHYVFEYNFKPNNKEYFKTYEEILPYIEQGKL